MPRTRPAPITARLDKPAEVIEFAGVSKMLSGKQILEDLSFTVRKGETFVIIGYSGTGKSVTLRHLVGLMKPDDGSIRVSGDEITTMTNRELELMRRKFGVLFQSGALIGWLSVFENVELPLKEHTKMSRRKRAEVVRQKLEIVNLWADKDKYPAEISGGMKKRAGLARALALDPEVILYDEPSSGLDPVIAHEIDKLIVRLRDELKLTQVVVTHDMQSAYAIASRIGMFYHGRMVQVGTPEEIRNSDVPEVRHFVTGGREGNISKRSITAILRGKPPTAAARAEFEREEAAEKRESAARDTDHEQEAAAEIARLNAEKHSADDAKTRVMQRPDPESLKEKP